MKIITNLDFQLDNTAVCIGKFDGIHRGHRLLVNEAKNSGLATVMITFLFPNVQSIYSREEKRFLAEELGIDILVEISVTKEFMRMQAKTFSREILAERLGAKKVVVGADFCFGYKRAGNVDFLIKEGKKCGFEVFVFEKLRQDGEVISSTRIREEILKGNMSEANALLVTPYFLRGKVEEGNHIGRTMSVPTANLYPPAAKVLPPYGVYAVRAEVEGKRFGGVGNLGVKPTIPGENPVGMEVWLFGYNGNLYGKVLTVSFIEFLRHEKKFASIEELKEQIKKDTNRAEEILSLRDR